MGSIQGQALTCMMVGMLMNRYHSLDAMIQFQ
jgi:hypothetical protein